MAAITINAPDAVMPRIADAFEATFGLAEGQTQAQLVKKKLQDYLKDVVRAHEVAAAADAARDAAADKVERRDHPDLSFPPLKGVRFLLKSS